MKILLLFFLSAPISAGEFCISGDMVRLRKTPSLTGEVIREFYHGYEFDTAVPEGQPLTIQGQTGQWMKVSRRGCAVSCIEHSGYIFSPYITACNAANEKRRARLLDSRVALGERVQFRAIGVDIEGERGLVRLLPGGKSGHSGFDPCDFICLAPQVTWTEKAGRLILNFTVQKGLEWTKRFTCEYSGIESGDSGRFKLISVRDDPKCAASIW